MKLSGKDASFLTISEAEREKYEASAKLYRQDQCLTILDYLVGMQHQIRFMPSGRIALEAILLHIMRSHHRVPVDFLVHRLSEIEHNLSKPKTSNDPAPIPPPVITKKTTLTPPSPPSVTENPTPKPEELKKPFKTTPKHDTLLQFSAVELEGTIQKK